MVSGIILVLLASEILVILLPDGKVCIVKNVFHRHENINRSGSELCYNYVLKYIIDFCSYGISALL